MRSMEKMAEECRQGSFPSSVYFIYELFEDYLYSVGTDCRPPHFFHPIHGVASHRRGVAEYKL